ncbi:MAG: acyl-CoA thioesterase [Thermoguttaceae bacterium]|nr:acyl-CoA thioesterase [Thermoguttaceae bacterium]
MQKSNIKNMKPIKVFSRIIEVVKSDVDVWGHANNVCYLHWMQDVAVGHSAAVGWTPERYLEYGGIWVVRRHEIEYRQSAFEGEKILAQTWIEEMKNVSCVRRYHFLQIPAELAASLDGVPEADAVKMAVQGVEAQAKPVVFATAATLWGFVSTKTLRPVKVAQELRDLFGETLLAANE